MESALIDPGAVTGRTIGHLPVLDGSFTPAPFELTVPASTREQQP